ncbi:hypothetical protein, conserved [Babesia bigemina]|uniref:Uncharacterized protein n=1 Tax=Babesia bigemina TaxID=5866 RepID=A0A061DDA7_BABBI|nr:hypothetical protein, conserved [Babesia bigemina]CDR97234.1 hypothetical protein, conserved [Babesia bigemina]|eukprot:XP_012769420.1 hypothetical protein, conserved [Babesia bigemina]
MITRGVAPRRALPAQAAFACLAARKHHILCVCDLCYNHQSRGNQKGTCAPLYDPQIELAYPKASQMGKVSPRRRRRAPTKGIPKNAVIVPNVPTEDYCSQMPGVYYHFGKLEWRTTCRDPFNCSKRSQRTFGVRKYGFYEAKTMAELAALEWEKHRNLVLYLQNVSTGNAIAGHVIATPPAPPVSPEYIPYMPYDCYAYVPEDFEGPYTQQTSMDYYNESPDRLSNF